MNSDTLILVDGSSFLYRAYYAPHGKFTTHAGLPTGATLIITRMLKKLLAKYDGYKIIVVFDAKGKSFRTEIYKDYKANRPPMPDDLRVQIDYVHKIVQALNLPLVQVNGVEADDVLGSYAKQASAQGLKTIICTGDKDLAQLVDSQVSLYDTMSDKFYDEKAVVEKFGVPPKLIIDYLALKGDSSDNIPGMKGVGDVKACTLLNNLGGIFDIYDKRDEIKHLSFRGAKTFAKDYEEAFDVVKLSYELATIKTDIKLPIAIEDVKVLKPNFELLISIYKELEFVKLIEEEQKNLQSNALNLDIQNLSTAKIELKNTNKKEKLSNERSVQDTVKSADLFGSLSKDYTTIGVSFYCVNTVDKLDQLCSTLLQQEIFALDTETTSLRAEDANLIGISIAYDEKAAFYIPIGHEYLGVKPQLPITIIREKLGPILANEAIKKVGHNIKYDLLILHYAGFEIRNIYFDTMVAAHLIDNTQSVSMDALALQYLDYHTITYEQVVGSGNKALCFNEVNIDLATNYAAEDAFVTLSLYKYLDKELNNIDYAKEIFFNLEMPIVYVLFQMEKRGALLSAEKLKVLSKTFKQELSIVQQEIYSIGGSVFNIASPKQLSKVLFDNLKIKYPKKPKMGKDGQKVYSTAEDILNELINEHPIIDKILRYRTLAKLITTYTDKLVSLISPRTHRLHTSFNQAGTVTGRLSSSDPNLQNIPARTEEGKLIRHAFIAPEGYSIVSIDYSQIELRLIAHIAEDPNLIDAFNHNADIHRLTAAQILKKNLDEVTDDERSKAKATNFGLMYGMGAHRLAMQTKMSYADANHYIKEYFNLYPNIHSYMDKTVNFAKEHGYVETLMHRHLFYREINSSNKRESSGAMRAAINAPMQGSAAEIIKIAMIKVQEYIDSLKDKNDVYMILQVHDELIFEIKDEKLEEISQKIKSIMESVMNLKVPLVVSVDFGKYWM